MAVPTCAWQSFRCWRMKCFNGTCGDSPTSAHTACHQTGRSYIQVCRVDVMMQEIGLSSDITMVSPPQGKMRKHGTHHSKTGFHSLNDNSKHLRVHIPYYY